MNKGTVFLLVIVVTVLSCAGYSNATILGTIDYSREGSGIGGFSGTNLSICYPLIENGFNTTAISFSWDITEDDIGETFVVSADTHEIFNSFVSMLTNGINDMLFLTDDYTLKSKYDLPGAGLESTFISGIGGGVDFEGYRIDSIALTINDLFFYRAPLKIHFGGQANPFDSGRHQAKAALASTKADLPSLPEYKIFLLAAQKQLLEPPYNIGRPIEGVFPGIPSSNHVPPLAISTYHLSYDITYTINGAEAVPEPTTVLLIGLGAVALRRKRKG